MIWDKAIRDDISMVYGLSFSILHLMRLIRLIRCDSISVVPYWKNTRWNYDRGRPVYDCSKSQWHVHDGFPTARL